MPAGRTRARSFAGGGSSGSCCRRREAAFYRTGRRGTGRGSSWSSRLPARTMAARCCGEGKDIFAARFGCRYNFLAPADVGLCLNARGCAPLRSPMWEHSSHTLRGEGAPPLRPRVTFPTRGKSPKVRQGLHPLESPEGDRLKSETLFSPAPPAASRNPLNRVCATKIDRFATLGWWGNRSYFFLWFH